MIYDFLINFDEVFLFRNRFISQHAHRAADVSLFFFEPGKRATRRDKNQFPLNSSVEDSSLFHPVIISNSTQGWKKRRAIASNSRTICQANDPKADNKLISFHDLHHDCCRDNKHNTEAIYTASGVEMTIGEKAKTIEKQMDFHQPAEPHDVKYLLHALKKISRLIIAVMMAP